MDPMDVDNLAPRPRPRTWTVLGCLALATLVISYLGAYAFSDALVRAELLPAFTRENDPRPLWMLGAWTVLTAAPLGVAAVFRLLAQREMRRLGGDDAEEDVDDRPPLRRAA